MASNKRVNISIPEESHKLLQEFADQYYAGNFSRFITDAGVFFAGVLQERIKMGVIHEKKREAFKPVTK